MTEQNGDNKPATVEPSDSGDQDLTFWQMLSSVMAAAFGVQSSRNRQRDFSRGKPMHFIIIGIGFTAKIRDAVIRVEGGGLSTETTNTGFVPLLNFLIQWNFAEKWHLILEGDALASPGGQGRAEDILLGVAYSVSDKVRIKAGYRVVEGGADVDTVYNFAWINYFMVGTTIHF